MIFDKKRFQELREAAGLSMADVAKACEVSKPTVQRWEKKDNFQPLPKKIPLICSVLHCAESDLVKYGPLEKAVSAVAEEEKQVRKMFFGANVGAEIRQIRAAVARRDALSKRDPNFAAAVADENLEIRENLRSLSGKLARSLGVGELPESAFDDFRFGLLRALIKSDLPAEAKDKALQVVESYHP